MYTLNHCILNNNHNYNCLYCSGYSGYNIIGSFVIFILGSYALSQYTIPSYLKDSYSPIKWYVLYPGNAWTSLLYSIPPTPLIVKIPLMTLSISSFSLWANNSHFINFIDVTSIYWVVVTTTLYALPYSKYSHIILWFVNSSSIIFIIFSINTGYYNDILLYYDYNIIPLTATINIICSLILYSYYADNLIFNIAAFFIITGYLFKLKDIYYNTFWGTSVFHVFTAIGIHILIYMNKKCTKNKSKKVNLLFL